MLVKICGITRLEDAAAAAAAGASAVGFVFWPNSPRYIDPAAARRLASALPLQVTTVGVFVNAAIDDVRRIAVEVGLGAIQLHGDEDPEYASQLPFPILKAVTTTSDISRWPAGTTLLVDAADGERRGGTGRTVDWTAAAAIARVRRTILAGGLTPDNVADAVRQVRPFGIDVSSGVERAPGVKDHRKIRALFESLHAISHQPSRS
jgi:phosphoribosylanthranilate isomerase